MDKLIRWLSSAAIVFAQRGKDDTGPNFFSPKTGASDIVGTITNPINTGYPGVANGGLIMFFSNILRLLFVGAGIYALLNFIMGGFGFMSAGGDAKKVSEAWSKIWQTLMGLVFIVGSFALAALFGQLIFGKADYILNPVIYGPGK